MSFPRSVQIHHVDPLSAVIVGTRACLDIGFLRECLGAFGAKLIVGIDARDGMIATDGWTKVTATRAEEVLDSVATLGGSEVIYTDISKDGRLEGPNLEHIERLVKRTPLQLIASGGVSGLKDIQNLLAVKANNLLGVIVGKALYEKKLDLKEAVKACSQSA